MFMVSNDILIVHSVTMMSIHNQTPSLGCGTLQEPGSKGVGTPEHMLQHRHMLSQVQLCTWG